MVYASGPNGLQDAFGRHVNGSKNVVLFPAPGRVIHIEQSAGAGTRTVPTPAAIDALLELGSQTAAHRPAGRLREVG